MPYGIQKSPVGTGSCSLVMGAAVQEGRPWERLPVMPNNRPLRGRLGVNDRLFEL